MDLFRLLSRSTKLSKNQKRVGSEVKLPSSGQIANPQLFGNRHSHDARESNDDSTKDNATAVLGKRKREGQVREVAPTELDFFGGISTNGSKNDLAGTGSADDESESRGHNGSQIMAGRAKMADEERRSILKTHKIKVVLLEEPRAHVAKPPPKQKSDATAIDSNKQQKRQIWPEPLTNFAHLRSRYAISRRLAENIDAQGYKIPTEVQLAAIPLLMDDEPLCSEATVWNSEGLDLLAVAPTGSGKTLAFLLPAINSILRDKRPERNSHTQAIILAPTRELAHQIVNEGKKLMRNTGLRITLMRKGMRLADSEVSAGDDVEFDSNDDENEEHDGPQSRRAGSVVKAHIVVSTPLVLVHSLELASRKSAALSQIRHLILDEADVLLDPLFRDQVETIWNACTNSDLRVSLWSATMASSIENFAMQQFSKLGHAGRIPIVRLVVGLKDTALPTVTHKMIYTGNEAGKLLALRQLLHPVAPDTDSEGRKALRPPFLVFTQTIERAKALQAELQYDIPPEAGGSARMAALHSELSEKARENIMTAFRSGEIWIIITTDLLARGVDFRGLNGVVNYDVPTSATAYIHRVGRTGRAGREGGVAVTFYTKEDIPYVKPIANVIAASEKLRAAGNGSNEPKELQQWMLDALPTTSKRERRELKKRGVEMRRAGAKTAMISTKSSYDRRHGGKRNTTNRGARDQKPQKTSQEEEPDFAGFSD
ncbi:uncharacterized protein PV09_00809 [Verruconis gallopava]|uniref:ATP-dependent RNA helicase ROK1 n=1 Tax=Verruconis gallopava TaxID=253628 RepID=A0A0D1Z7E6_9PEZI|nr:uncharacterized protein PV09_00809 [Verruconis gallopava]KIW08887.1 hypothetical protein PV09_00809 [Verruconis gallopava]